MSRDTTTTWASQMEQCGITRRSPQRVDEMEFPESMGPNRSKTTVSKGS